MSAGAATAGPRAGAARAEAGGYVRVYVWDRVVRTTHWGIAFSLLALSITGIYMGDPYMSVAGEARQHFVTGTVKTIHSYAAIVFTLCVLSRIAWMFPGRGYASWRAFFPTTRARLRSMWKTFLFYIFLRAKPPPETGHNALAGFAYIAVFGLYLVMISTGLGLYGLSAHVESPLRFMAVLVPLFGHEQTALWIHHVVMWLLIGFFVHHLYSSILMDAVEKNGLMASIVTGWKWVRRP